MAEIEKDIEQRLVAAVKDAGGYCLKWVCPGWAGVPDRICLFPGGRIVFVELKRPAGGVIASRQAHWAKVLRRLGFRVELICTKDAAVELGREYSLDKDLKLIRDNVTHAELWGQLAEEAAELAQAALKMQRLYSDNNRPRKTPDECFAAMTEEHADVLLCLEVLGWGDPNEIARVRSHKLQRWADQIRKKHAGV